MMIPPIDPSRLPEVSATSFRSRLSKTNALALDALAEESRTVTPLEQEDLANLPLDPTVHELSPFVTAAPPNNLSFLASIATQLLDLVPEESDDLADLHGFVPQVAFPKSAINTMTPAEKADALVALILRLDMRIDSIQSKALVALFTQFEELSPTEQLAILTELETPPEEIIPTLQAAVITEDVVTVLAETIAVAPQEVGEKINQVLANLEEPTKIASQDIRPEIRPQVAPLPQTPEHPYRWVQGLSTLTQYKHAPTNEITFLDHIFRLQKININKNNKEIPFQKLLILHDSAYLSNPWQLHQDVRVITLSTSFSTDAYKGLFQLVTDYGYTDIVCLMPEATVWQDYARATQATYDMKIPITILDSHTYGLGIWIIAKSVSATMSAFGPNTPRKNLFDDAISRVELWMIAEKEKTKVLLTLQNGHFAITPLETESMMLSHIANELEKTAYQRIMVITEQSDPLITDWVQKLEKEHPKLNVLFRKQHHFLHHNTGHSISVAAYKV